MRNFAYNGIVNLKILILGTFNILNVKYVGHIKHVYYILLVQGERKHKKNLY